MQLSAKSKELINRIANYAFYLALTIELLLVILDKSAYIIQYDGQWFRLTFVLFLIKLLLTDYTNKERLIIGVFVLLGIISYLVTGRNEILRIVVFISACKDVKHDFVLKYVFYTTLAGCLVLVFLSFIGIGTLSLTRDFGRGDITTRYCLGLGHPNGLHCMYWALSSLFLYIYERRKWISVAVIMAGNIGLYLLTDSRTGFAATVFTLILYSIMSMSIERKIEKTVTYASYAGIGLSFLISALMMSHKLFWSKLKGIDEFLTGRILWTHMGIIQAKTFSWMPFSARNRELQTDLGIVKSVYWYGYIPVIIFLLLCCQLIRIALKEGDRTVLVIVVSIILYSIVEGHEVSQFIARNYIFLLLGKYWTRMFGSEGGCQGKTCIGNEEPVG